MCEFAVGIDESEQSFAGAADCFQTVSGQSAFDMAVWLYRSYGVRIWGRMGHGAAV